MFKANFAFVWRNVSRLGVASANVDDTVQKVFLVVHRRLADFHTVESSGEPGGDVRLRSWLFQIVRRVARDERRASASRPATTATGEFEMTAPSHARPDVAYEERMAAAQIHAILASMEEAKREIFILSDLEGFTAPEIAEVTGVNLNTVYARLRAARQELERALVRLQTQDQRVTWNR